MSALRQMGALICAAGIGMTATLAQTVDEARFEKLAQQFRCLVCQNQNLAESSAGLALDLKNEIRAMMVAGKTDAEIKAFLKTRYGDFVLYSPPVQKNTWVLWGAPFVALAIGAASAGILIRKRRTHGARAQSNANALTKAERAEFDAHLR